MPVVAPHPDPLPAGGAREKAPKSPSPRASGEREGSAPKAWEGEGHHDASPALTPIQEGEALEQMNVLLVLQQRTVQRWNQLSGVPRPQHLG